MTPKPLDANPTRALTLLIAEDEMMVAMSFESLLNAIGHRAVLAGRLAQALETVQAAELDGAVLDINLHGESVYPLAEALDRRAIPFAFMTGYSADHVNARWRDRPIMEKPIDPDRLEALIDTIFSDTRTSDRDGDAPAR